MSKNHTIRDIVPTKIPKKLWLSKDYGNIILYALEVYSPMYLQEFVSRGNITDKILEKTFYNHIKQLKKKGYIEAELDEETRRRRYYITTDGEKFLKENLFNKKEIYGDLLSIVENFKYYEKKKVFEVHFGKHFDLFKRIEEKFLRNIIDVSHFYPEDKFQKYEELVLRLRNENILKRRLLRRFTSFIKHLEKYKEAIESDLLECESEIFHSEEIDDYDFKCPNCDGKRLIDYGNSFECITCQLEFEKVSFKLISDKEKILSNEEKSAFLDTFKDLHDEDE